MLLVLSSVSAWGVARSRRGCASRSRVGSGTVQGRVVSRTDPAVTPVRGPSRRQGGVLLTMTSAADWSDWPQETEDEVAKKSVAPGCGIARVGGGGLSDCAVSQTLQAWGRSHLLGPSRWDRFLPGALPLSCAGAFQARCGGARCGDRRVVQVWFAVAAAVVTDRRRSRRPGVTGGVGFSGRHQSAGRARRRRRPPGAGGVGVPSSSGRGQRRRTAPSRCQS